MSLAHWLAFLTVALAATFSPGPGVLMAISTSSLAGPRRAVFSSAGNACGIFVLAAASAGGAALMLRTAPMAYWLLKLGGAAYLVYLGARQWRSAPLQASSHAAAAIAAEGRASAFRAGLLIALSNPKALLFFSAVFPHFLGAGGSGVFLLLCATFLACTFLSHGFYVGLSQVLGRGLFGSAGMRILPKLAGSAMIAIGLSLPLLD